VNKRQEEILFYGYQKAVNFEGIKALHDEVDAAADKPVPPDPPEQSTEK
jgi:hypothetical protein